MALNINGSTYNYMNNFFNGKSSTNSSKNVNDGIYSSIGDLGVIKSGAYKKLTQKYYTNGANTKAAKENQAGQIKSNSNSAVASASKLLDKNLYEAKTVKTTDENGNTKETTDIDRSKILDNLKDFVKSYNATVKDAGESDNTNVLKSASRMVSQTRVYTGNLNRAGITIGSDNTLTLDEEKFKNANASDIKSLFTGSVSFGKNTQEKLYQIYSAANSNTAQSAVYNANAQYSVSTGSMFDSIF